MAAPIPNAEEVIASLRPKFRLCYRAGLRETPNLAGGVVMDGKVAPDGTVTSVTQHVPTTLPKPVVACLEYVLQSAVFAPPGGTGSSVRVPINFRAVEDAGT